METSQLLSILRDTFSGGRTQTGVFAADLAPTDPLRFPAAFIFNTDPNSRPGFHWVAIYYDPTGAGSYFDSYGLPPAAAAPTIDRFFRENGHRHRHNTVELQSVETDACGAYCVLFLRCVGLKEFSIDQLEQFFARSPVGTYDHTAKCTVGKLYSHLPRIELPPGCTDQSNV